MAVHDDNSPEFEAVSDRVHEPGPQPAEWLNAKAAAIDLGVSHMTVWR